MSERVTTFSPQHEMARLLVLDLPAGMSFGIDAMSCTTGDKFKGVGGILPASTSATGASAAARTRPSARPAAVVVRRQQQQQRLRQRQNSWVGTASSSPPRASDINLWRWDRTLEDLVPVLAQPSTSPPPPPPPPPSPPPPPPPCRDLLRLPPGSGLTAKAVGNLGAASTVASTRSWARTPRTVSPTGTHELRVGGGAPALLR